MDSFELVERPPTAEEYRRLRVAAGREPIEDEGSAGPPSAQYSCVVLLNGEAVACGRVVGDGDMYFTIQDVIVLPEFHGRGLATKVMDAVTRYLEGAAKPGAFVGLRAENVEGFYERYGFRRRPDDRPGMFRVW